MAHRDGDAEPLERPTIFVTGVLTASIAVIQELGCDWSTGFNRIENAFCIPAVSPGCH